MHAVRLERRSGVTRIVAPAELPRLGVPSLLPRSCARGSVVGGGTDVSSGGGSTPPNAGVGVRWLSAYVRFVTVFYPQCHQNTFFHHLPNGIHDLFLN